MSPYYVEPEVSSGMAGAGVAVVFIIIYVAFLLLMLALSIASYVLSSLGMYTVANRRGIKNPWLAWIPFGSTWILGSISDQFQYVAKGKIRNRRKVLLGLEVAVLLSVFLYIGSYFVFMMGIMVAASPVISIVGIICFIAVLLVFVAVTITYSVFAYIAYYDLFCSCNPDNAVLLLILSIFISYVLPVAIFIDRKKDLGMPPRKEETEAEVVVEVLDAPEE